MERDISRLEQAWLKAETLADEARGRVMEADRALENVKKQAAGAELDLLQTSAQSAKARHAAAEQMACDAFDRLWQAKAQGGSHRGHSQEQMNA